MGPPDYMSSIWFLTGCCEKNSHRGGKGGKLALASGEEANNRGKLERSTVRRTTSLSFFLLRRLVSGQSQLPIKESTYKEDPFLVSSTTLMELRYGFISGS